MKTNESCHFLVLTRSRAGAITTPAVQQYKYNTYIVGLLKTFNNKVQACTATFIYFLFVVSNITAPSTEILRVYMIPTVWSSWVFQYSRETDFSEGQPRLILCYPPQGFSTFPQKGDTTRHLTSSCTQGYRMKPSLFCTSALHPL